METKDECWPDGPLNLNADFTFTFAFIEYNGSNADKNQQSVRLSNGQKFLLAVMKIWGGSNAMRVQQSQWHYTETSRQ